MSKSDKVHFVAVSEAIRQRAIEYGLPKEKIRTIYSGIDLDKFPVTEIPMIKRPLKILFVGRLIEKKGQKLKSEKQTGLQTGPIS